MRDTIKQFCRRLPSAGMRVVLVGILFLAACAGGDDSDGLRERAEQAVWQYGRDGMTDAEIDQAVDELVASCERAAGDDGYAVALDLQLSEQARQVYALACPESFD